MNHHRADKHELNTGDRSAAGLPFRFLLDAFWVQWRILLIPWQALVFWVSCCTNVMVRFLTAAGAPPITYKDKLKARSLLPGLTFSWLTLACGGIMNI